MIKPSAFNREKIKNFLIGLLEDELIEKIIIPLFSLYGYVIYRVNMHGPGEHGKDIIFYRHVPLFFDSEFVVVQAKAEKGTTKNVSHFAGQVNRALKVPLPGVSGNSKKANYVMFINSMEHSNDANHEFIHLVHNNANVKILSQQNLIELIILISLVPDELKGLLDETDFTDGNLEEGFRRIITGSSETEINDLFEKRLLIETLPLSDEFKSFVINYIFLLWNNDRTWVGTVKPMKWLNNYFDFLQPNQYVKLLDVFKEYTSSYPSREASSFTAAIIKKIKASHIKIFEKEFILFSLNRFQSNRYAEHPLLENKIVKYSESKKSDHKYDNILKILMEQIVFWAQLKDSKKKESEKELIRPAYQQNNLKISEFIDQEENDL